MLTRRTLTSVYENDDFQLTGISVSHQGRLFVCFPLWSDRYLHAVVEVGTNGSVRPFPDETWNQWDHKPASAPNRFVCVQSVVVDSDDQLWIVDAAAPLLASVVPGGAKLVQVDLRTDRVVRVIRFEPDVVLPDTYLNDVRVDTHRRAAYLTDSGHGGIIVVDLLTERARRVLDGHPSVMVEPDLQVVVDGKELLQNGKPPQFQADGIALSPDCDHLYYKPVTARGLYRVPTAILREAVSSNGTAAAAVERVATTFPTDGLWMDDDGRLYLTDVTHDAVSRFDPDGRIEQVVSDARLQWPDTLSQGPDGAIYVSASQINHAPTFNGGKSTRRSPYAVFRFMP